MAIESGDNVQIKRTFYTAAALETAAPVLDDGLIVDVETLNGMTKPTNITIVTTRATKTGDGSTAYTALPYDQEINCLATDNVTFGTEFANEQIINLIRLDSYSDNAVIDLGASAPNRYIVLQPGDVTRIIKRTGTWYVLNLPEIVIEKTATGDQTLDLTSTIGYPVGSKVWVKNMSDSYYNIDIDLTDNIPLGGGHSLHLWRESDGWHSDSVVIDRYTDGTTGQKVEKLSNGKMVLSLNESTSFSSGSQVVLNITFAESFADTSYYNNAIFDSTAGASGNTVGRIDNRSTTGMRVVSTINTTASGTTNTNWIADGLWTTQTMLM